MAKKDGTNGKKIGRHGRNPSSKMQAIRSAANKARRIKAASSKSLGEGPQPEAGKLDPLKQHFEFAAFQTVRRARELAQRLILGRVKDERGIWRVSN